MKRHTFQYTWLDITVCVIVIFVLAGILFPALQASWDDSRVKGSCRANFKRLGEAFHLYAEHHNRYWVPRFTLDEQGEPLHSWRTLLLPYLDEAELYEKIIHYQSDDATEHWRENLPIVVAKPSVYSCPRTIAEFRKRKNADVYHTWEKRLTSYQAVFGPNTLLFDSQPRRFSLDETEGEMLCSILLAESGTGVHWLETLDLPFSTLSQGVQHVSDGVRGVGSFHVNGANVLKIDGSVIFCSQGPLKNEL